jgi:phage-related protein
MNLLDKFTPNFIWKNQNALIDHGLIIEQELPYIVAKRKYEEITIIGSNRTLHEWFDDYEPFDFVIPNVSIDYEKLPQVKRWLVGKSQLITHNDPDKYCHATCNMSAEQPYQNEWGTFYTFSITFRCEPLKYKVNEPFILLKQGENVVTNHGDENAKPFFEINSNGGNIALSCGGASLTVLDTAPGLLIIDNELSMCLQGVSRRTKGNWLRVPPGDQVITLTGNVMSAKVKMKGAYL